MNFYSASPDYATRERPVASPYIRGSVTVSAPIESAVLKIAVVGLYELSLNGEDITRGFLSPYRSNPSQLVFVDSYDVASRLKQGENVIGIRLGNGFSSTVVCTWEFTKLSWRAAPKFALSLFINGSEAADASAFRSHPSDVVFDDFHCGEHIDASKAIPHWDEIGFDDSSWAPLLPAPLPKGQLLELDYPPIRCYNVLKPKRVFQGEQGVIVDFGVSTSGTYRMKVRGEKGKTYYVYASDGLTGGTKLHTKNITCNDRDDIRYRQCDWLTLSGGEDTFRPRFTSKGCRFLEIQGMNENEMASLDIVFEEMSSLPDPIGHFHCDNEKINYLQDITLRSDRSNFEYYPYDCPQREKNGWTADASLSAEQMLLNFDCAPQFKNWMRLFVAVQKEDGSIPGIIPTDTWGFAWGAGPAWDVALFEIPYRSYIYSGDKEILQIALPAIRKYLGYMKSKENADGCYAYGLPDWQPENVETPLEVSDTIYCKVIAETASKIFEVLSLPKEASEASDYASRIKANFLKKYAPIQWVMGSTQAWLALGLYYGMYDEKGPFDIADYNSALGLLCRKIDVNANHADHGVLGNRAIYRALADRGEMDRAVTMLTNGYPSLYARHKEANATTLGECLFPKGIDYENLPASFFRDWESFNHQFYGDISAFFYRHLAGLRVEGPDQLVFCPNPCSDVHEIEADHRFPSGVASMKIHNDGSSLIADLFVPEGLSVKAVAPMGYAFDPVDLHAGSNRLVLRKAD